MKLLNRFRRKNAEAEQPYYRSIEELPVWNFNKYNDTSDYRYLLKLPDYFDLPEKYDAKKLSQVYENIITDLFLRFGFDEAFINGCREDKAIMILKLKVIAGERSLQAIVDIKEHQINERAASNKKYKVDFEKKVATLEAHFKKEIDVYKISVLRFYTYMAMYSDYVKKNAQYSAVK